MVSNEKFQERINYRGDLTLILIQICKDFNLGSFYKFTVVTVGYEDLNIILYTSQGKFFVKIFSSFRDEYECTQYVNIMEEAVNAGVAHPKLYLSKQGYLDKIGLENDKIFLCVMEYIQGENFQQLNKKPTYEEGKHIIREAARINSISLHPKPVYDSWAIPNFLKEYEDKNHVLSDEFNKLLLPLIPIYKSIDFENLPHCFIHGDIIATNIMLDKKGNINIIDFAVANYYPRIQEIAVLLCDLFFTQDNPGFLQKNFHFVLNTYQKYIPLKSTEIKSLPNYVKLAHGMHLLRANYEKIVNKNISSENEYFLKIGRLGLQMI
jgi:Ser/Thr protein kinase RdoA (MazF antagonist)